MTASIQDSILDSVKHMLGIEPEYPVFDPDIIIHTNSALSTLNQLGLGPDGGLEIADNTTKWNALLGDAKYLNNAKTYVYLRVRLIFDPPTSSFALQSFQDQCKELEWRMQVAAEDGVIASPVPPDPGEDYMTADEVNDAIAAYIAENGTSADVLIHTQDVPLATWIISHTLDRQPVVAVFVDNEQVDTDVVATNTVVVITFPTPTAGTAVLT